MNYNLNYSNISFQILLFYFSEKKKKFEKKESDADQEDKNFDNNYFKARSALVTEWKKCPELHPYPNKFNVTLTHESFIAKYNHLANNETLTDVNVAVAGRVYSIRNASSKLHFLDLRSDGHKIQVMASAKSYNDQLDFKNDLGKIRRGDIIGVEGSPSRTLKGELSIIPKSVRE